LRKASLPGLQRKSGHHSLNVEGHRTIPGTFHLLAIIFISLSILLTYGQTLHYAFQFDDQRAFLISSVDHLQELTWASLSPIIQSNRPVAHLSFAINYYLGGLDVRGYHLFNIGVHWGTALVIYALFLETLSLSGGRQQNPLGIGNQKVLWNYREWIALIGALLWAVHPVQTQAVTYVVQRMASLAAFFYLLSLLFYILGRTRSGSRVLLFYSISAVSALLAVGTKENSLTLPLMILLYDLFFITRFSIRFSAKEAGILGGFLLVGTAGLVYVFTMYRGTQSVVGMLSANYGLDEMSAYLRVISEWRVLLFYLTLLILPLPSRMNLDPDFPLSKGLFDPMTTLFSLLALLGLAGFALLKARRHPLLSFSILWFLVNLAIESTIIKLDLVFEHRLYLPSVFFFLPLSISIYTIGSRFKSRQNGIRLGIAGMLTLMLMLFTHERNRVWETPVSLWSDTALKSPRKLRAVTNLGRAYLDEEKWEQAKSKFEEALLLDPNSQDVLNYLGNAYQREGRYELAVQYYMRLLAINRNNPLGHHDLGTAYLALGKTDLAFNEFSEAVRIDPRNASAYNGIGFIYMNSNQPEKARAHFQKSIELNPKEMWSHLNLGILFQREGKTEDARKAFKSAVELAPHSTLAQSNYGYLLESLGQKSEAIYHFNEAVKWAAPKDLVRAEQIKNHLKELIGGKGEKS
jgi:tetratricopeptide (TPR) repeat protein